jgi:hypothetical protein
VWLLLRGADRIPHVARPGWVLVGVGMLVAPVGVAVAVREFWRRSPTSASFLQRPAADLGNDVLGVRGRRRPASACAVARCSRLATSLERAGLVVSWHEDPQSSSTVIRRFFKAGADA